MPVRYHGPNGPEELIPAPLVDISKNFIKDEGGTTLRSEYTFTLSGTIVNIGTNKDSPSAFDEGMEGILSEQARIRTLFSVDGGRLEIESPDGGGPNTIDAYCKIQSINFPQGVWVDRCPYTIVLSSGFIEMDEDDSAALSNQSENWIITENDDGTFAVTHSLSATGVLLYGPDGANDPLEEARVWCRNRSSSISTAGALSTYNGGTRSVNFTEVINPLGSDSANFWNHAIVESVGSTAYSWQLTESFIYNPNGNCREEFSASVNFEPNNPRRATINVSGNITGLADKSSNSTLKLTNAKTKFASTVEPNLYTRIATYIPSGYTVNPVVTSKQVSYEDLAGTVRYSYSFTAASGFLITDALDENISVHDTAPTDVFAQIQVPGRANGPVVQNMNTKTLPERTVSINVTLVPTTSAVSVSSLNALYLAKPNTDSIVDALKPSVGYYYIRSNDEEWNPIKRQYSRTVSWIIQPEGQTVQGIPSTIHNPQ